MRSIIPGRPCLLNKIIDFGDMVTARYYDSIDGRPDYSFNHYRDEQSLNVHKSFGYLVNPVVDRVVTNRRTAA